MLTKNGIFEFEQLGDIALITMNNPPRNRLPDPVFVNPDVLAAWLDTPGLRGAILTGEGKNFCEGALIDENIPEDLHHRMSEGKRILDIIEESPVPVVAAINGACFGGGLEVALACHLRVAGHSAMFGFPEAELNIMPGLAGTLRSIETLGYAKALPFLLSSEYVSAEQALNMGLVHHVVPRHEVLNKAFATLAQMVGDKRPQVINYIMQAMLAGKRGNRKQALELESKLVVELVEAQFKKQQAENAA